MPSSPDDTSHGLEIKESSGCSSQISCKGLIRSGSGKLGGCGNFSKLKPKSKLVAWLLLTKQTQAQAWVPTRPGQESVRGIHHEDKMAW